MFHAPAHEEALQGEELPSSANVSIVLPPFPRYEMGHIPPMNLTAIAILASQVLQVGPSCMSKSSIVQSAFAGQYSSGTRILMMD